MRVLILSADDMKIGQREGTKNKQKNHWPLLRVRQTYPPRFIDTIVTNNPGIRKRTTFLNAEKSYVYV